MAKAPQKHALDERSPLEALVARYGLIGSVLVAVIGLIGTVVTTYFGYLMVLVPIHATQTAAAIFGSTPFASATTMPTPTLNTTVVQPAPPPLNLSSNYRIIQPSCNCTEPVTAAQSVILRLKWGAKTSDLAERGADFIIYTVTLDGAVIQGIENYRKPAVLEKNPPGKGDPENAWWVYWDYPLGTVSTPAGYTIEATLLTLSAIDTGWNIIPTGTKVTLKVNVVVVLPAQP